MKHKILTALVMIVSLTASAGLVPAVAGAAAAPATDSHLKTDACAGLDDVDSSQGCSSNGSSVNDLIASVISILSFVVGIVAVIMVIINGLRYIISAGEASAVSSAKRGLIYALVGLVIAALAQFLVHFVFNNANTTVDKANKTTYVVERRREA